MAVYSSVCSKCSVHSIYHIGRLIGGCGCRHTVAALDKNNCIDLQRRYISALTCCGLGKVDTFLGRVSCRGWTGVEASLLDLREGAVLGAASLIEFEGCNVVYLFKKETTLNVSSLFLDYACSIPTDHTNPVPILCQR